MVAATELAGGRVRPLFTLDGVRTAAAHARSRS